MLLVSYCSCLYPIRWSQVLSWEWRCSWSSADRRCSNYIWVINNLIVRLILETWRYIHKGAGSGNGTSQGWGSLKLYLLVYPFWKICVLLNKFCLSNHSDSYQVLPHTCQIWLWSYSTWDLHVLIILKKLTINRTEEVGLVTPTPTLLNKRNSCYEGIICSLAQPAGCLKNFLFSKHKL